MAAKQVRLPAVDERAVRRLVESASRGGHPDVYEGKRGAARVAAAVPLDVTTDPTVPTCAQAVTMHNISLSGFAFWSRRQLPRGTPIYVREFSADNSKPWVPARVTHCTIGLRGFLVGAAFDVRAS